MHPPAAARSALLQGLLAVTLLVLAVVCAYAYGPCAAPDAPPTAWRSPGTEHGGQGWSFARVVEGVDTLARAIAYGSGGVSHSLAAHVINTVLVLAIGARALDGDAVSAALGAALFAAHPVASVQAVCSRGVGAVSHTTAVLVAVLLGSGDIRGSWAAWSFSLLCLAALVVGVGWEGGTEPLVTVLAVVGTVGACNVASTLPTARRSRGAVLLALLATLAWSLRVVDVGTLRAVAAAGAAARVGVDPAKHAWPLALQGAYVASLRLQQLVWPVPSHASPLWADGTHPALLSLSDPRALSVLWTLSSAAVLAVLSLAWLQGTLLSDDGLVLRTVALFTPASMRRPMASALRTEGAAPVVPAPQADGGEDRNTADGGAQQREGEGGLVEPPPTVGKRRAGSKSPARAGRGKPAPVAAALPPPPPLPSTPARTPALVFDPSAYSTPAKSGSSSTVLFYVPMSPEEAEAASVLASAFTLGGCLLLVSLALTIHAGGYSDTQLYLPMAVGGSLMLAALISGARARTSGLAAATAYGGPLLALLLCGYAAHAAARTWGSHGGVELWQHAVEVNSGSPVAHLQHARALLASGAPTLAVVTALAASQRFAAGLPLPAFTPNAEGMVTCLTDATGAPTPPSALTSVLFPWPSAIRGGLAQAAYSSLTRELSSFTDVPISVATEARQGELHAAAQREKAEALEAYTTLARAVQWRGAHGVLSPTAMDVRDFVCSTVGLSATPSDSSSALLLAHPDVALTHAYAAEKAGQMLLLMSAAEHAGNSSAYTSSGVDAWFRSAVLLSLSVAGGGGARGAPPGAASRRTTDGLMLLGRMEPAGVSDAALMLGDGLSSVGLSALSGRVHELGLDASAQEVDGGGEAPAAALLRAVTTAILTSHTRDRLPGVLVAAAPPPGGEGGAEGVLDDDARDTAFHAAVRHLSEERVVTARPRTSLPSSSDVCVGSMVVGSRALRVGLPASLPSYSAAAATLRALLGTTTADALLHSAPVCNTPHAWNSTCGRPLIAANRAASAAVGGFRGAQLAPLGACTCTRSETEAVHKPGAARVVALCASQSPVALTTDARDDTLVSAARDLMSLDKDSPTSSPSPPSILGWVAVVHGGCGVTDGVSSDTLPAALAGWMHCPLADSPVSACSSPVRRAAVSPPCSPSSCKDGARLAALLGMRTDSPGKQGGMTQHRAVVLAARAHALTLLAIRHLLPGAPPTLAALTAGSEALLPSARSLLQAVVAASSPASVMVEACGCE